MSKLNKDTYDNTPHNKPNECLKTTLLDFSHCPWRKSVYHYPQISEEDEFIYDNSPINISCLQTLQPDAYINDEIINTFLKIVQNETGDTEPLIFESMFAKSLDIEIGDNKSLETESNGKNKLEEQCNSRLGFFNKARQIKAWTYNIWLIPKCSNAHWTLTVILFYKYKCNKYNVSEYCIVEIVK